MHTSQNISLIIACLDRPVPFQEPQDQRIFLQVALPVPFARLWTYCLDTQSMGATPREPEYWLGRLVQVEFGKKRLWGVVWAMDQECPDGVQVRNILFAHPWIRWDVLFRAFLEKTAHYYIAPLGSLIKMALPSMPYEKILQSSKDSEEGAGQNQSQSPTSFAQPQALEGAPLTLSHEQQQALDTAWQWINATAPTQGARPLVLEGVTGSGKSELILALCEKVWQRGEQVLLLLPEIILAPQWVTRAKKYFSLTPFVWHSALSKSQRQKTMAALLQGGGPLFIGARSALFLPYAKLGLIVVDEEHDGSYKQSEGVLYHGRDVAVLRASLWKIPALLASASPSLETRHNVVKRGYGHVRLHQRYGNAPLPTFKILDIRDEKPKSGQWLGASLRHVLVETLKKGQQSLVFLNRRGYACILMCPKCAHREACSRCSAWMSVHRGPQRLICHYCGAKRPIPEICPACAHPGPLLMMGPGIQRIAQELQEVMPTARLAILSSDHVTSHTSMDATLTSIKNQEVDSIVGTQLVAKGHHFPHLTCISIVDTDFVLTDMDFRASERLFQLMIQVTGRAGRAQWPGIAYLQTHYPHHPLFEQLAHYRWDEFVTQELEKRRQHHFPPFCRLSALTLSHRCPLKAQDAAFRLKRSQPELPPGPWLNVAQGPLGYTHDHTACNEGNSVVLWGPSPAPMSPLKGRYRWRLLLKTPRDFPTAHYLHHWIGSYQAGKGEELVIDRDPYIFL